MTSTPPRDSTDFVLFADTFWVSPYVLSSFVALQEKGLPFDVQTVDMKDGRHRGTAWATSSLTGRVPALRHGDFVLSESSAIAEYLEDLHPDRARLLPAETRPRARARQIMAFLRSDLGPLRAERSSETVFYPRTASPPPLTTAGQQAADKLVRVAGQLVGAPGNLFGAWCLADTDLAMMLQRLVHNGDPVPAPLAAYAEHQWQRASVRAFLDHSRAPFVPYDY
jgi:glutathione S-transferase